MEKIAIKNGHILTYADTLRSFEGSVFVDGGSIVHVGDLDGEYRESLADEVIDARGCVITPGFVNLHTHAGSNALRGLAEDVPLTPWLNRYVLPAHKFLNKDEARSDYLLAYMEMIKAGITSALDMYRFLEEGVNVANLIGIRANLLPYGSDLPEYEYLEKPKENIRLFEKYIAYTGLARIWLGFEHSTYCTDECLRMYGEIKKKYNALFHTHESETLDVVKRVKKRFGMSPVDVLRKYELLGPKTVLAHGVWFDDKEIAEMVASGTSIAHNPTTNMKLASGVAPVAKMLKMGANVGLGTDSSKCNNRLDMIQEMKAASLLQKVHLKDASIMSTAEVFKMATVNGAKALGMGSQIGRIEAGYKADLAIIDFKSAHLMPMFRGQGIDNTLTNLVYSAMASDVKTVLVDGRFSMKNRKMINIDEEEVIKIANEKAEELLNRMGIR
ncbi:MAG: amidohydrolase [Nitrososphaerota archaeon]|jgi:5-methylthioadenosine/S-adenosylhomocysteine deaminase|nr:amidohydrolase [Nitrososphaerota archaeon]MDG7041336.1 amidohydrolase [Nitrososphaerota archaeon]MDG7043466.1 amidohydrolase [Nitrososphaerota archaeon]